MSATASPAKFAFDLDLGQANEKSRVIGEYALAEMLRKAEEKGYARGLVDGESTATATAAKALSADAETLVKQAREIENAADAWQKSNLADAIQFALSVAKKLAGNMIARRPLGEIEKLIGECFASLEGVPHLVIRCSPQLADKVKEEAEAQMKTSGFSGRLVILGEPEISLGDARLEWVDGGLVRDISALSAQIDERVSKFLDSQTSKETINKEPGHVPLKEAEQ